MRILIPVLRNFLKTGIFFLRKNWNHPPGNDLIFVNLPENGGKSSAGIYKIL